MNIIPSVKTSVADPVHFFRIRFWKYGSVSKHPTTLKIKDKKIIWTKLYFGQFYNEKIWITWGLFVNKGSWPESGSGWPKKTGSGSTTLVKTVNIDEWRHDESSQNGIDKTCNPNYYIFSLVGTDEGSFKSCIQNVQCYGRNNKLYSQLKQVIDFVMISSQCSSHYCRVADPEWFIPDPDPNFFIFGLRIRIRLGFLNS